MVRRFVAPIGVSLLFVAWSPFIGEIRGLLRDLFPGRFVLVITGLVGAALVAAAVSAVVRIRERRGARYGAIIAAMGAAAWYAVTFATGDASVDAVERFHFVEYGLVGFLFYRALVPARDPGIFLAAALWGLLVGTAEESMQWLAPRRVGEARDVVLNLWAVGCGLLFGAGVEPPSPFSWRIDHRHWSQIAALAAVVVAAFAVFYDAAHLGYEIDDDEVGRFRSHFTRERLIEMQRERVQAWRADPPTGLPLVGIEDYYLTEAGSRVQLRNRSYANGVFRDAWLENRILEKYWDPYLELHSFSSGALHRWAPEQRAEVETKAGGDVAPGRYTSPVLRETIATVPTKTQFWMLVAGIELLLVAALMVFRYP